MEIINVVDVINIVAKERKNHLIKHFDGQKIEPEEMLRHLKIAHEYLKQAIEAFIKSCNNENPDVDGEGELSVRIDHDPAKLAGIKKRTRIEELLDSSHNKKPSKPYPKLSNHLLDNIFKALCNDEETRQYLGIKYVRCNSSYFHDDMPSTFIFKTDGLKLRTIDKEHYSE